MRSLRVLCLVCLIAVGCKGKLDSDKLVAMIRDDIFGSRHIKTTSVTCPKDQELKVNTKFTCEVKLDNGETVTMDAEVLDGDGTVSVKTRGEIIDPAKIAALVTPK